MSAYRTDTLAEVFAIAEVLNIAPRLPFIILLLRFAGGFSSVLNIAVH